jgi:transcriptional regulatory protein LevR
MFVAKWLGPEVRPNSFHDFDGGISSSISSAIHVRTNLHFMAIYSPQTEMLYSLFIHICCVFQYLISHNQSTQLHLHQCANYVFN